MELRHLKYFVTVVEEAGFTRAAARLHVAQPGISAQIRLLERELGASLLDRSGRRVTLTAAGAAVLPYARAALAAVDNARVAVDELTGLIRGHVTVGIVTAPRALNLPGLLSGFHAEHPGVEISLRDADADTLIAGLRDGSFDLAVITYGSAPQGIATQVVIDQAVVAAVSPSHELAGRTAIDLADLRDRPLICLPRGSGLRRVTDEAFASQGIQPHIAFEAGEPYLLAQLAAQGMGVALLPESVTEGLCPLRVRRPELRGRMSLAWREGGPVGSAARALVAYAREFLPDVGRGIAGLSTTDQLSTALLLGACATVPGPA